ncbi:hypothetical protein DM2_3155 [Halorubrum sp. DM2]|nr:hypothetical protein DM2_3155 [Halorubrum sp. DM2]
MSAIDRIVGGVALVSATRATEICSDRSHPVGSRNAQGRTESFHTL